MQQNPTLASRQRGITFLELLIVVAIVAMISAFAFPSYMQYIVKTKRTAATSALLQIADRQQQFFMDNKTYATDLSALGFAGSPLFVSDAGKAVAAGDDDAVYVLSIVNVTPTTYTATAAPLAGQLERDTDCGTLTLSQAGTKDALGGGDDCW
ncbi:MAG: type IV pilin protein [Gammaproteobacteria bacterium]|jgi:type IV pilus assembly protein PilE|nr:type IV pilin protein [Gammaproteobacteria bacterium]MDH3750654.1 type IV pilin protein [Gammaproteobacteria bacterium]MDH3804861.1 type IV pilin protein [Gammaproteobacteria bacterium]